MDQERMESHLEGIRHLLSNLHGEVTALEESYSQVLQVLRTISTAANVDDLTGLLRRRSFFQKWEALLDECQRLNQVSGVLMIDIDHFKRINDTHGHATGDEVIRNVASLLKQFASPDCIVSRVGGEEFAVAIRGSESEISGVAELIRKGAEKLHGESAELKCTVSIGVAMNDSSPRLPGRVGTSGAAKITSVGNAEIAVDTRLELRTGLAEKATALLSQADAALYDAKHAGRNRVCHAGNKCSSNSNSNSKKAA
jgi:diguanylate cyclase (GGDEF)-like protein